jgi:hypothetical protein
MNKLKSILKNDNGNFFSEHALGIVITIVIGAILLIALTAIFKDTVIPGVKDKIAEVFLTK